MGRRHGDIRTDEDWGDVLPTQNGGVPSGVIVMWHGLITAIPTGWALCNGANGTPDLRGKFVKGAAAGVDPGTTGGNLTHTHASHPALSHSGMAVDDHAAHTHSVTSNVTVADHSFTQPTIAWPAGVPTASGAAVSDHAAHTHSVTSNVAVADHAAHTHSVTSNVAVGDHASHTHTYTDVPNHVHVLNVQGGTTAATTGTHCMTSTATGGSARAVTAGDAIQNNTGGVVTGTTAGPSATLSHSVTNNAVTSGNPSATLSHSVTNNAVTSGNPSATLSHSVTQPTIAWPAGVPTASGGAVNAHSVTNNAVTSGNPSATLSHTVTQANDHASQSHDTVNHEPPYYEILYIMKL